jgi:amino-acid N-acetyltransferase
MQWAGVRRCRGAAMMWSCRTRSGEPQRKIRPPSFRLVREARLNPRSLRWERFVVADRGGELVGAAQVRRHPDGSRELASLVVRPQDRGHGIAGAVIDTLLADEPGPVFTVVDRRYAEHFRSWDFDPVEPARLPPSMRIQLRIGRVVTGVGSLLLHRRIRLQPLRRPPRHPHR